ncbi:probable peptidyl-tRNA hydrolase 2 [Condylostylus longicornis]|uniref:probable peptidyl-tRNA hydrolase 2 n=1 Tax=Condylostylus longicornis TaxID=2530218 RepID=UPI00244DCBE3|nr:probable peptidyl-tRNA hydrolase 2 [Condylostylus longicornis]
MKLICFYHKSKNFVSEVIQIPFRNKEKLLECYKGTLIMSDRIMETSQFINGIAILLSFYVGYKYGLKFKDKVDTEGRKFLKFRPDNRNYKMLLIVRNDLKMGKGKIAAQCGHAAVDAYQKAKRRIPDIVNQWECTGCAKVALKVESEKELMDIKKAAESRNFITSLIRDAGRTQIEPNTKTVLAVGPDIADELDKVTGHLRLL